ncbi:outer membrane beta-barrel protein [Mesohalobacter halotolerans]|uniref:Porin family protein n=1 Tax=Mesohalobacter halotolerans TaxID=1883405 RepID=A0A4V6AMN5_9FLAO|nr:outer membrane beta-barrel protein [Mesohalobacter halotolerans]MBS3738114.1 outer membrane beta-barrel protein [Psychroflexus sp.]TKS57105.1 porin family protein [Mesohalobacter halotolerans]
MRKTVITVSLLLCFAVSVSAQNKFSVTYNLAFPSGNTSDLFESTSWRGVNFDYHHFLSDEFAIGFSTGWQIFSDELGFVTETSGTETLSGFRYNYLNSYPILLTGSYFFNPDNQFSPYASIGLGFVYNELNEDIGILTFEKTGWPFSVRPEIGIDYELVYNLGLRASFKYNYVASGDELPSLPYFAFNIGLVWTN